MKKSKCVKAAERYIQRKYAGVFGPEDLCHARQDFIDGAEALLRHAKRMSVEYRDGDRKFKTVRLEFLEQWAKGEK